MSAKTHQVARIIATYAVGSVIPDVLSGMTEMIEELLDEHFGNGCTECGQPESAHAGTDEQFHCPSMAAVVIHSGQELTEDSFVGRYCDYHGLEALAYRISVGTGGMTRLNESAGFPCEYEK